MSQHGQVRVSDWRKSEQQQEPGVIPGSCGATEG